MTPFEREAATTRAQTEYNLRCRHLFHAICTHLATEGRESLPPVIVMLVDAAQDARDGWYAAVDAFAAEQRGDQ